MFLANCSTTRSLITTSVSCIPSSRIESPSYRAELVRRCSTTSPPRPPHGDIPFVQQHKKDKTIEAKEQNSVPRVEFRQNDGLSCKDRSRTRTIYGASNRRHTAVNMRTLYIYNKIFNRLFYSVFKHMCLRHGTVGVPSDQGDTSFRECMQACRFFHSLTGFPRRHWA